ncbi:MAG TPA: DUF11 domain-containing protein, partial [Acidimicrobiia bacterium]|nr:DUF11 domain-containing protein [Acidimicrobiia bacterium]
DMFGCEGTLDDCEEDPDFERVFDGDDYDLDVDLHDFTFGEVDGGGGETPTGADLSVTKIALPVVIDDVADLDSPPPGRDGLFRFTVTNEGPEATTASVVDELPPGLVLADDGVIIIGYPCSTDGNTTSCIFELQPGESVSYDIFYDAEQAGTFTNTVTVSGDAFDPDLSNNTASADAVVVAADLAAAVVGPSEIDPSAPFDVTFRLTNNGPATPEGQHLIVTLPYEPQTVPAGCTLVPEPPSSMRTYLCLPAADLASGESAEFTFTTGIGFFGNYEAEADASNLFDPDVTNNQAESYITYP